MQKQDEFIRRRFIMEPTLNGSRLGNFSCRLTFLVDRNRALVEMLHSNGIELAILNSHAA